MAFNGAGLFLRIYNWVSDTAAAINITASRMDAEMDGFASGLSNCITRDGQGKPSAAIDWNGQNLSNVAALTTTGNTTLGDAAGDTLNVGAGGIVKDASGNVGLSTAVFGASNLAGYSVEPYAGGVVTNIGHTTGAASLDAYLNFRRGGTVLGSVYQFSSTGVGFSSAGDLHLSANGAERITVGTGVTGVGLTPTAAQGALQLLGSAGGGLKVGNTDNGYALALDWYEENTAFVPTLLVAGAAYTGSYSSQVCNFTRIGNRVSGEMLVQLNVLGADVGALSLSLASFPYPPSAGITYPCSIKGGGLNMASPFVLEAVAATGSITLFLGSALGGTSATNSILQNSCSFVVQFNFRCA